ncbi:MAG: endopeptidase La [Bacteroidales bacterium]|nr:endopeptidase La [Bacteroidales bacterium]
MHLYHLMDFMEGETEFIPLLSQEDEELFNAEKVPDILSILPLRNTVLFPGVVIPITVGRDKSIRLIKDSYRKKSIIGVVAQKDSEMEEPEFEDLNNIGTVASIIKILQMPDGSTTAIIQGKKRFRLVEMVQNEPFFTARVEQFDRPGVSRNTKEFNALISSLKDLSIQIIKLSPNIPSEAAFAIQNIESPVFLVNFVSSNLNIEIKEKQKLLEISDFQERSRIVLAALSRELQVIKLKNQIQDKVKSDLDKQQRDFLLHQQLKTIQEELGGIPGDLEIKTLREKALKKKWPDPAREVFERELAKLQRMHIQAAEYSVQLNYLDLLVDLPWNEYTKDNFELSRAQGILDEDHYGLELVKERIIEYLAVIKLKNDLRSPILCLVGPPGVGKTSLGKSIARALSRNYIRMSLGGMRDEAELRGHRKTYVGAMPGRIIQNIKKARSSNPVFVLDEIDKVSGANISGDPQAALLEILDPEQNVAFHDNYLEVDFDLSRVMFIATANNLSTVHPALIDRMEVIEISGYLVEEKVEIARRHLVPKQLAEHGVKKGQISFPRPVIEKIIGDYTREAGVRRLEKHIAKIIRKKVKSIVEKEDFNRRINTEDLHAILKAPLYKYDHDLGGETAGVVTGLAWTATGGDILFIEVSLSHGKGQLTLTGNLGDVMKESATIAFEYLKSHAVFLGLKPDLFRRWNVHIHVPEGATPKDGPSAGITMFTALVSAFTQQKVRPRLAMTGEITLRGKVLPVGGIKEKLLAARRYGIREVILSSDNLKDIDDIRPEYLKGLHLHYIDRMIDIVPLALQKVRVRDPLPIE